MKRLLGTLLLGLCAALQAQTTQPAAIEMSWTPLRLPTGQRTALLGGNYLVAMNADWGLGPGVYGAAQGDHGGIFTVGFSAQRRWALGADLHLAASLYVGAGGGLSTDRLRFGGGLMLRPELSLRQRLAGDWYGGLAFSHTSFPNGRGNVRDGGLSLVLGHAAEFRSHAPAMRGEPKRPEARSGMGFDELSVSAAQLRPEAKLRTRGGALTQRFGTVGAALRQYRSMGSWWGLEAAGAASGEADGYMEIWAGLGRDHALAGSRLRLGWQLAAALGGGGEIDTGSGWLLRAGPTLRWITPWGPSLQLDALWLGAVDGPLRGRSLRLALAMPLAQGASDLNAVGPVREQQLFASLQQLGPVRFKDGRRESVGQLGLLMTRELSGPLYGVAQAGSAAFGSAGAYSYGLIGLGLQGPVVQGLPQFGAELSVGAAGGGEVAVQGGAVAQAEAWARWSLDRRERVRLRVGLGQWRALRGQGQSSSLVTVSLGYAYGTV